MMAEASLLPQVIKKLDPKQQPHVVPLEIQALKNQLQEKDKKISHLEVRPSSFVKDRVSNFSLAGAPFKYFLMGGVMDDIKSVGAGLTEIVS